MYKVIRVCIDIKEWKRNTIVADMYTHTQQK